MSKELDEAYEKCIQQYDTMKPSEASCSFIGLATSVYITTKMTLMQMEALTEKLEKEAPPIQVYV